MGNLGDAYTKLGDTKFALSAYDQALERLRDTEREDVVGEVLGKKAQAHAAMEQPHEAIDCYQKVLIIARKLENQSVELAVMNNLGIAYTMIGDPHAADLNL